MTGIYKIQSICKPSRVYIGSAVNIDKRWKAHLRNLRLNKHHSKRLQNHFNKYGEADLEFNFLFEVSKNDLINAEQFMFDAKECYFNICRHAGNWAGNKHKSTTKSKLSKLNSGNKNPMFGKSQSKEHIEKRMETIRIKFKSESFKSKMRELRKKQPPMSAESKEKLISSLTKKRIEYIVQCSNCKKEFKLSILESKFLRGDYRKSCSSNCAHALTNQSLRLQMSGINNPMHSVISINKMLRTKKTKKVCRLKVGQRSLFN